MKDNNQTYALIATIWFDGIEQTNRRHHLSLINNKPGIYYITPIVSTSPEGIHHANNFATAMEDDLPIFGVLKLSDRLTEMRSEVVRNRSNERIASNCYFALHPVEFEVEDLPSDTYRIFELIPLSTEIVGEVYRLHNSIEADAINIIYNENRFRQRGVIESAAFSHKHSIILNKFMTEYSGGRLVSEFNFEGERIDAVGYKGNVIDKIFEIKTEASMKSNIRSAIGQLLGYSKVIKSKIKNLYVVSNAPIDEEGVAYLSHVRSLLNESSIGLNYIFVDVTI